MFNTRSNCTLNIPALIETLGFQVTNISPTHRLDIFQYKFENGMILSIGVGNTHYANEDGCDCAVFGVDGEYIPLSNHDDVRGYVDEAGLVELARQVATDTIPEFKGFRGGWAEDFDTDDGDDEF